MAKFQTVRTTEAEAPVVVGPSVRSNVTPLDAAFVCMSRALARRGPIGVAVGDVRDYTGKYNQNEGNAVTQGGALMAYSALGKLAPAVRVHERFDTRIGELELVYTEKRQLGDGAQHTLPQPPDRPNPPPGVEPPPPPKVPWLPYFGGSIRSSDYYIVGGITELNYNIQSGGAELAIQNAGPKARVYTSNVAIDLRIVDTRSLVVIKTVSLQKQITGYEVGADVFRFFGTTLFDINIGTKSQEPLQLAVRTTIELAVLELIGAVTRVDHQACGSGVLDGQAGVVGAGPVAEVRSSPPVERPARPAPRVAPVAAPKIDRQPKAAASEPPKSEVVVTYVDEPVPERAIAPPPPPASSGWFIQVGSFPAPVNANDALAQAQRLVPSLASTRPEAVPAEMDDGGKTYRARFNGFDSYGRAAAACEQIKSHNLPCMVGRR